MLIFSALNKSITTHDFRGGRITAVFGGGQIDLKDAQAESKEITLDIAAVFGGVKVIIPQNWKVNSIGTAIVGGFDNKTRSSAADVTLIIKGTAVMGGVEIVN
jgi:predicted membrane protein